LERLERLADDADREVRELADRALVASGGRRQSPRMLRALSGGEDAARRSALESLERVYRVEFGRLGFGGVPAEKLLADWAGWVRDCWPLSEAQCLERAARAAGSRLRGEAVLALAAGAAPAADRAALKGLAGELAGALDPAVRAPAAAALVLLGERRGRELILADLASAEWPARYAACRAAAFLAPGEAGEPLAGLLADQSSAIRAEAHRALCRLAGRDLGFEPEGPAERRAAQQLKWLEWARSAAAGRR
jgi:HEAT repeat protein